VALDKAGLTDTTITDQDQFESPNGLVCCHFALNMSDLTRTLRGVLSPSLTLLPS
jgi:hypothetical protein